MKKILFLLLAMPLLMACKPEEPSRKIIGEYTYYISGNVRWWGEGHDGEYSALWPEAGTLVIAEQKNNNTYLATFITDEGDSYTCDADADEDMIYLFHGRRNLKIQELDCSALFSGENCYLNTKGFNGHLVYQGNPLGDYTQSFTSDHVTITAFRK